MTILFTILHVVVCFFLILVVLAQQGKGQDLASAFGGGGSQTAFGARGTATLLSKITAGAAVVFMITSLTLSYLRPAVSGETVVPETAPAPAAAPEVPGEREPGAGAAPEAEAEGEGEGESGEAGSEEPPPGDESESDPPA